MPGDSNGTTRSAESRPVAPAPTAAARPAGASAGSARVVMPGAAAAATAGSSGGPATVQRPYTNTIGVNACQVRAAGVVTS